MACVPAADAAVFATCHIVVLLAGVLVRLLVFEQQPDGQRAIAVAVIAAHPLYTEARADRYPSCFGGSSLTSPRCCQAFDDKVTDMSIGC